MTSCLRLVTMRIAHCFSVFVAPSVGNGGWVVHAGGAVCGWHLAWDDVAVDDEGSDRAEARLTRSGAVILRSAAEQRLVKASRQRAESVHERADAASELAMAARHRASQAFDRFNGLQDPGTEKRKRYGYRRGAEAGRQERKVDERQLSEQVQRSARELRLATAHAESLTRTSLRLGDQGAKLRAASADLATQMAEQAEVVASYFENKASGSHRELGLAIAKTEYEVARIGRQNAARLRDLSTRYKRGDTLPRFPGPASDTAD
jgi:hypothetical protein